MSFDAIPGATYYDQVFNEECTVKSVTDVSGDPGKDYEIEVLLEYGNGMELPVSLAALDSSDMEFEVRDVPASAGD